MCVCARVCVCACVQADGGVVNAVAAAGALRTLAQRAGALHRENLLLRGERHVAGLDPALAGRVVPT